MMLVHVIHTTISPKQLFPATYDRPKTCDAFRHTAHSQRHLTVAVPQYLERHVEMRSPAHELNFAPNGLVGFAVGASGGARIVQVPGPQKPR